MRDRFDVGTSFQLGSSRELVFLLVLLLHPSSIAATASAIASDLTRYHS